GRRRRRGAPRERSVADRIGPSPRDSRGHVAHRRLVRATRERRGPLHPWRRADRALRAGLRPARQGPRRLAHGRRGALGLRGELWTLRWEDATELRYQATRVHAVGLDLMLLLRLFPALGKSVKIGFVDVNGKRRKLPSSLKAMDVLAERVIEHHTAAQFPALRSALDRGEEMRFGKSLSLAREQVSVRKLFGGTKRCLLSDVDKVSVDDGKLKIRQRGKTFAFAGFALAKVPNAF